MARSAPVGSPPFLPQAPERDLEHLKNAAGSNTRPKKRQLFNSFYGLLDYSAYPIGMLAVAPLVLRKLDTAQYGIWTIAIAIVSFGSTIASGFGDANIQQVATARAKGRADDVVRIVRSTLGIHLVLGCAIAIALWFLSPYLAGLLAVADPSFKPMCLSCIRIASLLTLIRSVESVCISTQRGFERYGSAVKVSIAGRLLGLAGAGWLASNSHSVASMMATMSAFAAFALALQLLELKKLVRARSLMPRFDPAMTRTLLYFGIFTWILSATGVVFSQSDRLIGGASVGASAVVAYALCAQIAQPVYGLTAAGLHFLFPYIAFRRVTASSAALRSAAIRAILANCLLVMTGAGLLLVFSHPLLRLLATQTLTGSCASILPGVLASSALLALTVSGNYLMMAVGQVRPVAFINVTAAVVMGFVIAVLLPERGIWALISARLIFASIAALVYIPLIHKLRTGLSFSPLEQEQGRPPVQVTRVPVRFLNNFVEEGTVPSANLPTSQAAGKWRPYADILGIQVDSVNMDRALAQIEFGLKNQIRGYICMAGVHGVMEAQRNPAVLKAFSDSWMNLPDGMPTVWVGRWQRHHSMERVTGPDLMIEIFRRVEFAEFSHFFYGGKPGVAEELATKMSRRFPWLRIAGTYTPPFRDLTLDEERDLISTMHRLKPSIIWVGISTPRQELFMRRYLPLLETSLMFGVGAAFDYHTGRIKDCAEWVKRAGLQWLHRLVQDPRHLLWRYLRNNPAFILQIGLQLAGLRNNRGSSIRSAPWTDRTRPRDTTPDLCAPELD